MKQFQDPVYFGLYLASSNIFFASVRIISSGFISGFFDTYFLMIWQPIH